MKEKYSYLCSQIKEVNDMTHLTYLTNYFKESSRVPRTRGTREKVTYKCVNFVKSVKFATDSEGAPAICRKYVALSQRLERKMRKKFGTGRKLSYLCNVKRNKTPRQENN